MSVENWKKIWNKREDVIDTLDFNDTEKMYMELKRLNGFDITDTPVKYTAWYKQYNSLKDKLHLKNIPPPVYSR